MEGIEIEIAWEGERRITESGGRDIPSGWKPRPLCIPVMAEGGMTREGDREREEGAESLKERFQALSYSIFPRRWNW